MNEAYESFQLALGEMPEEEKKGPYDAAAAAEGFKQHMKALGRCRGDFWAFLVLVQCVRPLLDVPFGAQLVVVVLDRLVLEVW